MYIVKTTVTRLPFYEDQVFLMYVTRSETGFQPLQKKDALTLLEIFENYPSIFKDPYLMVWDKRELELTNTSALERYDCYLTFEFLHLMGDISKADKKKLLGIPGRVLGFSEKFAEGDEGLWLNTGLAV